MDTFEHKSDRPMSDLRKWRLMVLALRPKGHRYHYGEYLKLEREGLVWWQFGWAHLTMDGYKWIVDNSDLKHTP